MNRQLIIRPEAQADLIEAYRWYEERSQGLGLEFALEADACLNSISDHPDAYSLVHKKIHRALVKRFPFAVYFVLRGERIFVIGCVHIRRNPRLWKKRV